MSVVAPVGVDVDWSAVLPRACAGEQVRAVYQPLVDIQRGQVVGYEALVRFGLLDGVTPDVWFDAARRHQCDDQLEAVALSATLAGRRALPPNCFLSVNLGPAALSAAAVIDRLDQEPDLHGIILEVTEHVPIDSYAELSARLEAHRNRGALVAVDDAGAGYAGLAHILEMRPSILKLDRALVSDVDHDEAKRALIEMLGVFAGRIDAWVLAEGVETMAELQTLRRLGVPLAQGYVLGRPNSNFTELDKDAAMAIRSEPPADFETAQTVRMLVEANPWVQVAGSENAAPVLVEGSSEGFVVVVDEHQVPVGAINVPNGLVGHVVPVMRVASSTPVVDAARRALTRDIDRRFEPLVCTDATGRLLGVVRVERIIEYLAGAAASR